MQEIIGKILKIENEAKDVKARIAKLHKDYNSALEKDAEALKASLEKRAGAELEEIFAKEDEIFAEKLNSIRRMYEKKLEAFDRFEKEKIGPYADAVLKRMTSSEVNRQ